MLFQFLFCITQNDMATIKVEDKQMSLNLPKSYTGGFVGFGTGGFYPANFDNINIYKGKTKWCI